MKSGQSTRTRHTTVTFYVSPNGHDQWTGKRPAPNRSQTDGPLKSVQRAVSLIRQQRKTAKPNTSYRIVFLNRSR